MTSQILQEFYDEYGSWLDYVSIPWYRRLFQSRPSFMFDRSTGLCHSLQKYFSWREADPIAGVNMLTDSFRAAGLGTAFPFNTAQQFYKEVATNRMHLNPKRIEWVNQRRTKHAV